MEKEGIQNNSVLILEIFNAIPSFVLLVDEDVRIQEYNKSAAELFENKDKSTILKHRGGEVLHCLHSKDVKGGCGRAPFCKNCVIRNSVNEAFKKQGVFRLRAKMELVRGKKIIVFHALVTTSLLKHNAKNFVLLIIEDINEIMELKSLLPICCKCKRIRNDKDYWIQLESYFKRHLGIDFTHGYCPACLKEESAKIDEIP